MKITLALLLLLPPIFCFSNIKGRLIDSNKNPIPYANIVIKNTSIGVISNLDGDFDINIPDKYLHHSVVFSSIGFKSKEIAIQAFENQEIYIVELENAIINLNEVIIKVKATNANEIVQKAFDHYEQNFPTSPFLGKAFLRHTEKTKIKYKWLVDAAIEVYDPGVNQKSKEIKLNIEEIKQSFDNRCHDTALIYSLYLDKEKSISLKKRLKRRNDLAGEDSSEINKAIQYFDNLKSNPYDLFSSGLNVIRYYKQKDAIFDKNILKKHNFKIDSVLAYDSDEIYKIKITPKSPLAKLNKHYEDYVFPIGWIYIRAKDYAIFELQYTLINGKKNQYLNQVTGTKINTSFSIKFIEINGKMYPKHITFDSPKKNKYLTISDNNYKGIKIDPEDYYYETQEVMFNKIITDSDILAKCLEKSWDSNLFTPRPYNAKFWEKYSSMVETKKQKMFREKLEAELSTKQN